MTTETRLVGDTGMTTEEFRLVQSVNRMLANERRRQRHARMCTKLRRFKQRLCDYLRSFR